MLQMWCVGFSLKWFLLLQSTGSSVWASTIVVHRLSFPAACGIFPDQGLEPVSSAVAGGFLTT